MCGRVERDNCGKIAFAVENLASATARAKTRLDVAELRENRFGFAAATNFDAMKTFPLEKMAKNLLGEIGLTGEVAGIDEITERKYSEMLKTAARNNFCDDAHTIISEYEIDNFSRGFQFIQRKIDPVFYGGKRRSQKRVTAYAENLVCENLVEETRRLSENKKYGTPVHYIIQTEKMDSVKEIYNFLLDCLKASGRILRSVVNVWSNAYQSDRTCFYKEDMQNLFNKSEYGAVVIKSNFEEGTANALPEDYKKIRQICEVIKSNRKNVLTILCVEKGAQNQLKAWKDNLENMAFVEITEKAMFKTEAENYLLTLAQKDGIKNIKGLATEEDKGYSRSDLEGLYSDWYADYQKNIEFPEYKNFAVLERKPEQKVEGTAYSRLQNMIGLSGVKGQIENIISFARLEKLKKDAGLCCGSVSRHMVFSGNPGTAKTTVARLFAQIMKDNDLLTTGKFVETGRADLVDRYVGGTAPRVRDKFKEARGGVYYS